MDSCWSFGLAQGLNSSIGAHSSLSTLLWELIHLYLLFFGSSIYFYQPSIVSGTSFVSILCQSCTKVLNMCICVDARHFSCLEALGVSLQFDVSVAILA